MWHDEAVTLRSLLLITIILSPLLSLQEQIADAQSHPSISAVHHASSSETANAKQLAALQQAQAQAIAAGATPEIATTSRTLAKALLEQLATLEQGRGDTKAAALFEEKQRLLSASSADPTEHASLPSEGSTPAPRAHPQSAAQRGATAAEEEQLKQLLGQSYNDLGTAEARQGEFAAAETHFEEAVHWDKPTPTLLRNLGTAAFRREDFPTAVRAFGQYLEPSAASANPADPHSQLMYALSLFYVGDFAAAARAFAPISAETSQDARSAYSWAFSLAHSGDPTHANTIAAQLSAQPLTPDVLSLVCHIFIDTESYQQSGECYRKVVAADPTSRLAHYQIAESLIRLDRPAEAIPELRQELALNPDDPHVQYSLAFALLQTSNKTEAFALLRTITAAHPEMAQAQYQFGKLLFDSGDTANAVTHFELAEQADASLDYIHYQLQAAYRKVGRTADADREARLYREIKARRRDLPSPPP